jgi:hypothetical protein
MIHKPLSNIYEKRTPYKQIITIIIKNISFEKKIKKDYKKLK